MAKPREVKQMLQSVALRELDVGRVSLSDGSLVGDPAEQFGAKLVTMVRFVEGVIIYATV